LSYAVELFALAILLYVYDSSALLYVNEAILIRETRAHWTTTSGWRGFVFAGRSLCILNPFTPHWPAFRLGWNLGVPTAENSNQDWPHTADELRKLAPFTSIAGVALFVILPLGVFTRWSIYAAIPALIVLYASTAVALFRLHRSKILAAGGRSHFWAFAFECMACPPFAVNMVRRISLAQPVRESLALAGARLLDPADWGRLRGDLIGYLEQEIERLSPDSEQRGALEAQIVRLNSLGRPGNLEPVPARDERR
jgi:hypothetical protein